MAQQKDMPPDFAPKKTETDKWQYKGKDQGQFDRVSLEGQTRRLLAD